MRIEFANPIILLLIPLITGLLIFSARYLPVKNRNLRIKQVILHSIVFSLIITSLSGISLLITDNKVATVFVIDVSESTKDNGTEITEFVNSAIDKKKATDYVGVISFGQNASIENFLSENITYKGVQSFVETEETNAEDAVKLALSIIPEGYAKRIVLISDGAETKGSLMNTYSDVTKADCEIKVYELEDSKKPEIYVSNVRVPEDVGENEKFVIFVDVASNVSTKAVINLYQGRTFSKSQEVFVTPGEQTFTFTDSETSSGLKTYKVTIEALSDDTGVSADTRTQNNEYSTYTNITGKQNILVIGGSPSDTEALSMLLKSLNRPYSVTNADSAPSTLSELLEYSAVVMSNVHTKHLPDGFLDNIESYVKDSGRGLIVCGGRNTFGLGAYKDTPLEKILPVTSDKNGETEIPSTAIALVIDHSGSMSSPYAGSLDCLTAAKNAAAETLETVREKDYIGVIAFDTFPTTIVSLQHPTDSKELKDRIMHSIGTGGGTDILAAVKGAERMLSSCDASIKHIILLTDGQDSHQLQEYNQVISALNNESITLSTVAVGQGTDAKFLSTLAESCNGRSYTAMGGTNLPKLFSDEVMLSANTYIVDAPFTPVIGSGDEILEGVFSRGMPTINAYIATTLKPGAIELLYNEEEGDPLLAYRNYGLGTTFAWTSDITGKWSQGFFENDDINQALWNNIFHVATADNSAEGSYAEVSINANVATIKYHTEAYSTSPEITAIVTDDNGNSAELKLVPSGIDTFSADFEMNTTGVYSIAVKESINGEPVSVYQTAAIRKYSSEYVFNDNKTLLSDYVAATGGVMITSPETVFTENLHSVKAMKDMSLWFLLAGLLLYTIDIAYRRFRFRIIPESVINKLKAIKKTERIKKTAPSDSTNTGNVPPSSTANTGNTASLKHSETKKNAKTKKPKKEEADMLDTSMLLNRMKDNKK